MVSAPRSSSAPPSSRDATRGRPAPALNAVVPEVYRELHRLARAYLRRERPNHTLQPTALINEAYLRLARQKDVHWRNRLHFLAIAATTMRHVLVDHARKHQALKRGGARQKVSLPRGMMARAPVDVDLLALDDALLRLATFDPMKSRLVELRFFAGLSVEETASVLEISPATVKRHWSTAKAWLHRELHGKGAK